MKKLREVVMKDEDQMERNINRKLGQSLTHIMRSEDVP
jgi:hypothetical protein